MSGSNSSAPASPAAVRPEPLDFSVHGVAGPDLADPAELARGRTAAGRLKMLLVLLICAAPVIASYLMYFVVKPSGRSNYGTLITPTRSLPALQLQQLDGSPFDARSLRGQWLLLAVGPAACPPACEQRLYAQRQLREMLGRERDRLDKVWLVTDGEPLPSALQQVVRAGPALTALRADRSAVARWLSPEQGQQLEDHLYLVDPMGEWMMRFPAQADPARVKRDLDRVLRASASWDLPGR